ncbi:hypothetical protein [Adhaeribacter terreus]|uniref:Uncharacterized protein n=1 Tax=Adhaeribacter terreus TaxID=529703 RepID=A0ABW0E8W4_9BACT
MPKFPTFPTLYDEVLTIYISKLNKWGYLNPGQIKGGTLSWSWRGNQTANISIWVNTHSKTPYLELNYKCQNKPINYKVELVSVSSNLGKGRVWYFLCPHTGKRCRNLYLVGERFLHREAFTGCLYEKQTYSNYKRGLDKLFEKAFRSERLYEQLYKKHFKTHYAGKPTKRYLKLMKKIQESEQLTPDQIERLYLI